MAHTPVPRGQWDTGDVPRAALPQLRQVRCNRSGDTNVRHVFNALEVIALWLMYCGVVLLGMMFVLLFVAVIDGLIDTYRHRKDGQ